MPLIFSKKLDAVGECFLFPYWVTGLPGDIDDFLDLWFLFLVWFIYYCPGPDLPDMSSCICWNRTKLERIVWKAIRNDSRVFLLCRQQEHGRHVGGEDSLRLLVEPQEGIFLLSWSIWRNIIGIRCIFMWVRILIVH